MDSSMTLLDDAMWTVYHVLMDSELRSIHPDVPDTDFERTKYIRSRIKKLPKSSQAKAIIKLKRILKSVPSISDYTRALLDELDTEDFHKDLAMYSKVSRNRDAETLGLQTLDPYKVIDLHKFVEEKEKPDSTEVKVLILDKDSLNSRFGSVENAVDFAESSETYILYFSTRNPKTNVEFLSQWKESRYILQPIYLDLYKEEQEAVSITDIKDGLKKLAHSIVLTNKETYV